MFHARRIVDVFEGYQDRVLVGCERTRFALVQGYRQRNRDHAVARDRSVLGQHFRDEDTGGIILAGKQREEITAVWQGNDGRFTRHRPMGGPHVRQKLQVAGPGHLDDRRPLDRALRRVDTNCQLLMPGIGRENQKPDANRQNRSDTKPDMRTFHCENLKD